LYRKFGYSEDEAQYNLYREAEEWESLEKPVSSMLRKASVKEAEKEK